MLSGFLRTVRKIYFGHSFILWMILVVLPVGVSVFMLDMFSSQIVQHIPIGIVCEDHSQLADKLEMSLHSSPVLDVKMSCTDMSECEHAVIRGDLQSFIVIPNDLERRSYRFETPVIPIYSSGQNYLTNMFATKEIRAVITAVGAEMFTSQIPDPVRTEIHSVGNVSGNYQGFLALGLVAALFHLAAMLVGVYVASFPLRDHRVHEMLRYAKGSRFTLWLASILPMDVILWLGSMACYAYCHRALMPMTLNEFVMVSAAQLFMILACSGAGFTFVGVVGIMRIATGVAGVVGGPAFAFAGQTYPLISMPFAVRCFAFLLPLTHALKIQSMMLLGDVGLEPSWEVLKLLIGMAIFWNIFGAFVMYMRWKQHLNLETKRRQERLVAAALQNAATVEVK